MTVRLGFAVAAFLEPEILVLDAERCPDETGKAASAKKGNHPHLAEFQKKAIGKMKDVNIKALSAWGPQRKAA